MSSGAVNSVIDSPGRYAAPGYLLFVKARILMAQQFDEKRLALAGEPLPLAEPAGPFSVSAQQTIVYRPIQGSVSGIQQVVWIDRAGKRGPPVWMPGTFQSLRLSPDGHRLALDHSDGGNQDIWVIDLDRGIPNKLTFDPAGDGIPRWSPDGKQLVFTSTRLGAPKMFIQTSLNLGTEQPLLAEAPSDLQYIAEDWSLDGKYLVFVRAPLPAIYSDIWVKPMSPDGKPFPFVQSKTFIQGEPRVSPNSRWLAYTTNNSGTFQIFVQTFPDPKGAKQRVTAEEGGIYPAWSHDGRELYYLALNGKLMAVSVKEEGDKLVFGPATALFQSPLGIPTSPAASQYDTVDGKRFIFIVNSSTNPTTPDDSGKLTVVLNWTAALRKK
jgi:hypothetical protein